MPAFFGHLEFQLFWADAMPRFGTRTLLSGFAVLALWLSTFAPYEAADDVRRSIILTMFLGSAFAAICYRGKQRMFWAGFFAVFLIIGCNKLRELIPMYVPLLGWPNSLAEDLASTATDSDAKSAIHSAVFWTVRMAWILALSIIVGLLAANIYEQSTKSK